VIDWRFTGFIPGSRKNMRHRKESIDEAIHSSSAISGLLRRFRFSQ
jgi:hypothetical protein